MQPLEPFSIQDFSAGMISDVNESLRPKNSVALLKNCDADEEIGSVVTRLGTFIVGGQMVAGKNILGLHNHVTPTTSKLFSAINDTDDATSVVYDEAGNVVVTGLTASKRMRFLTYLSSTLAINGADAERAWNGSAWITTGGAFDLANAPGSNTCNLTTEFLDRVYLAGDTSEPDRLYYSGVASSGSVSWTSGNGFVDIEAEDRGGGITALGKVPGYILIFKKRSIHRWNYSSAFPESMIQIGTPLQESVVSAAGLCAFYSNSDTNTKGFYLTDGGRPVCISRDNNRPIKKWVDAISDSTDVIGWGTDRYFAWSVGNLTIDGTTYKNVVFRYNRLLNVWSIRTYPQKFTVGSPYLSGDTNLLVVGTNNGEVLELDKAETYTDYVTVSSQVGYTHIEYDIRSFQQNFGSDRLKDICDRMVVNSRNAKGAVPYVTANGGNTLHLPSVDTDIHDASLSKISGNYFEIGLKGTVQGSRLTLKSLSLPKVILNASYG